ncbi:(d)CMP kinase [Ignavigranum ruoffiae]|uniref:(d)CMP kinase n=1 Tax=Ignavigranum ruoffiae TaxID=89093 RepID=UPI002068EA3A|nr:(d)CMP kinase [Ignavigranum ruoffiae]UPQ85596.1 (d)CMP kinase [Ignavigranum ruoffiae]
MQIAIDGPASSGKSTIAKLLAQKLNLLYLDTGAMYRAITLFFIEHKVDLEQPDQVKQALEECQLSYRGQGHERTLLLNGKEIEKQIRSAEVNAQVSAVSAIPEVRHYLVAMQQKIGQEMSVIMDGRDIGTVVLKDADYKFYLTANAHVRALRRYQENQEKGLSNQSLAEIEQTIIDRDYYDSHRSMSPLKKAEDAIEIDTSQYSIEEVLEIILNQVKR